MRTSIRLQHPPPNSGISPGVTIKILAATPSRRATGRRGSTSALRGGRVSAAARLQRQFAKLSRHFFEVQDHYDKVWNLLVDGETTGLEESLRCLFRNILAISRQRQTVLRLVALDARENRPPAPCLPKEFKDTGVHEPEQNQPGTPDKLSAAG